MSESLSTVLKLAVAAIVIAGLGYLATFAMKDTKAKVESMKSSSGDAEKESKNLKSL